MAQQYLSFYSVFLHQDTCSQADMPTAMQSHTYPYLGCGLLADETRIGIFTVRNIAAGEELTYNYLTEQYGNGGAAFKCMCGAATCK